MVYWRCWRLLRSRNSLSPEGFNYGETLRIIPLTAEAPGRAQMKSQRLGPFFRGRESPAGDGGAFFIDKPMPRRAFIAGRLVSAAVFPKSNRAGGN